MNIGQLINSDTMRIDKDLAPCVASPFVRRKVGGVTYCLGVPEYAPLVRGELPAEGTKLRRIYDYLLAHPGGTSNRMIAGGTRINSSETGGYLGVLRERGWVTSTGEPSRMVWRAAQ